MSTLIKKAGETLDLFSAVAPRTKYNSYLVCLQDRKFTIENALASWLHLLNPSAFAE